MVLARDRILARPVAVKELLPHRGEGATRFVREVLGCGCPEEVLRSIRADRGRLVPGLDVEVTRIDAGGRLLVYVVPAGAAERLETVIAAAVEAGAGERDRRGFNRFRLVIAADDSAAIEPRARAAFAACEPRDERAHLHVVPLGELRALS